MKMYSKLSSPNSIIYPPGIHLFHEFIKDKAQLKDPKAQVQSLQISYKQFATVYSSIDASNVVFDHPQ